MLLLARANLLLGEDWSWKNFVASLATQEGVVRLAIICLALALFIMLKK